MREPRVSNAAVVTKPAINLYYKQSSVLIPCNFPPVMLQTRERITVARGSMSARRF